LDLYKKPPRPVGTPPKEGKCKKIIIYNGTPEVIVKIKKNYTSQFLKKELF
jgi:excinuclease UvrABC ATPase subunit